jgi:hypothetical protein
MSRWLTALLAILVAGCAVPRTEYTDRVEVDQAEIVIFFVKDGYDGDVEAALAALRQRMTNADEMQLQRRTTEEVELDPVLLASAFGADSGEMGEVGEAVLVDLPVDLGDEWLVETGDIMARQPGVQTVTIGNPSRRVDSLCYWGDGTDMILWLADLDSVAVINELRSDYPGILAIETLSQTVAFEQMLVLLEFQPELSSLLSVETMPLALRVDIGVGPFGSELMAIRDDLESRASISSVIGRPPSTVQTVCP